MAAKNAQCGTYFICFRDHFVYRNPTCFISRTEYTCFSLLIRAWLATAHPSRHVFSLRLALITCPAGHSTSIPARIQLAPRSSYVPGRPQQLLPGTYLASVSLFLRARPAKAPPSRHVLSKRLALLTCPPGHSTSQPQHRPATASASHSTSTPARSMLDINENSCRNKVFPYCGSRFHFQEADFSVSSISSKTAFSVSSIFSKLNHAASAGFFPVIRLVITTRAIRTMPRRSVVAPGMTRSRPPAKDTRRITGLTGPFR